MGLALAHTVPWCKLEKDTYFHLLANCCNIAIWLEQNFPAVSGETVLINLPIGDVFNVNGTPRAMQFTACMRGLAGDSVPGGQR